MTDWGKAGLEESLLMLSWYFPLLGILQIIRIPVVWQTYNSFYYNTIGRVSILILSYCIEDGWTAHDMCKIYTNSYWSYSIFNGFPWSCIHIILSVIDCEWVSVSIRNQLAYWKKDLCMSFRLSIMSWWLLRLGVEWGPNCAIMIIDV